MQGKYPVIFVSFADVKGTTFKDLRDGIISSLVELYEKHDYLLNSDVLTEREKEDYYSLGQTVPKGVDKRECLFNDTITRSIKKLMRWLNEFYGEKVIVLMDEYDTPMQEAYLHGCWEDLVG